MSGGVRLRAAPEREPGARARTRVLLRGARVGRAARAPWAVTAGGESRPEQRDGVGTAPSDRRVTAGTGPRPVRRPRTAPPPPSQWDGLRGPRPVGRRRGGAPGPWGGRRGPLRPPRLRPFPAVFGWSAGLPRLAARVALPAPPCVGSLPAGVTARRVGTWSFRLKVLLVCRREKRGSGGQQAPSRAPDAGLHPRVRTGAGGRPLPDWSARAPCVTFLHCESGTDEELRLNTAPATCQLLCGFPGDFSSSSCFPRVCGAASVARIEPVTCRPPQVLFLSFSFFSAPDLSGCTCPTCLWCSAWRDRPQARPQHSSSFLFPWFRHVMIKSL